VSKEGEKGTGLSFRWHEGGKKKRAGRAKSHFAKPLRQEKGGERKVLKGGEGRGNRVIRGGRGKTRGVSPSPNPSNTCWRKKKKEGVKGKKRGKDLPSRASGCHR